jgi:hypothetical protein
MLRSIKVGLFLLLLLVAAGCSDNQGGGKPRTQADWEEMARCLATNYDSSPYNDGIPLDYDFWVDAKRTRKTTVQATLKELGATLKDGKVYDAAGEELYFYEVRERGKGHPRPQKTGKEISELKKKYHVIRMYGPWPKD